MKKILLSACITTLSLLSAKAQADITFEGLKGNEQLSITNALPGRLAVSVHHNFNTAVSSNIVGLSVAQTAQWESFLIGYALKANTNETFATMQEKKIAGRLAGKLGPIRLDLNMALQSVQLPIVGSIPLFTVASQGTWLLKKPWAIPVRAFLGGGFNILSLIGGDPQINFKGSAGILTETLSLGGEWNLDSRLILSSVNAVGPDKWVTGFESTLAITISRIRKADGPRLVDYGF